MRIFSKFFHIVTTIIGTLAIFIWFLTKWLTRNFGYELTAEQIMWHVSAPLIGVDLKIVQNGIRYLIIFIIVASIWIFCIYKLNYIVKFFCSSPSRATDHKSEFDHIQNYKKIISILFLLFLLSFSSLFYLFYKHSAIFQIKDYFIKRTPVPIEKDFFAKHYFVPTLDQIHFNQKKNLVIVLVESMENSFSNPLLGNSLTPNLDHFKQRSQYNQNMVEISGTDWTVAAMASWHFGLPLKIPADRNAYSSAFGQSHFLPKALSIFDVLEKNGYEQILLMGGNKIFSGIDNLHKHGNFKILDSSYWQDLGWDLNKYKGTRWGYSDKFTLERAKELFHSLSKQQKPFVLLISTLDTHAPHGYCPKDKIIFNDIRDPIIETDRLLGDFLNSIPKDTVQNTVIAIIGDHYFMGNPEFLIPVKNRSIYNAFYGNIPKFAKEKTLQKISALDIAPTLLESAGARWNNHQFGLGFSLFSDHPSYTTQYNEKELNENLKLPSSFYERFY